MQIDDSARDLLLSRSLFCSLPSCPSTFFLSCDVALHVCPISYCQRDYLEFSEDVQNVCGTHVIDYSLVDVYYDSQGILEGRGIPLRF